MAITMSHLNRFTKLFTGRFLGTFEVQWLLTIPPHLAYVATLPCELLMSENKRLTINYKEVLHRPIYGVVELLITKLGKV